MWLHDDCLTHDALLDTWTRLGLDRAHQAVPLKEETESGLRRPLSPSDTGAASTTQQSIDVKTEEKSITLAEDDAKPRSWTDQEKGTKARGHRKSTARDLDDKPYLGYFEAALINESGGPPMLEITDLRHDVSNGESTWKKPVKCLNCREIIQ
jgi:hypothetical protein